VKATPCHSRYVFAARLYHSIGCEYFAWLAHCVVDLNAEAAELRIISHDVDRPKGHVPALYDPVQVNERTATLHEET
jgi:hypothetical protein